ncbi:hypothetical protein L5515_006139 [Caenorhabditis briggsae]|uniref:Uncharacterized protein n=1 Tax=Caenorhabditis briggsae TaxID=6238 RepID=A0AAE9F3P9_CAEBR|nr:hypothetical protein L3Y34_006321 [Caenorhabditis briggsae]UMM32287.1 hypothetical protein L5515_006139 [Caenorhabditis briggsae]
MSLILLLIFWLLLATVFIYCVVHLICTNYPVPFWTFVDRICRRFHFLARQEELRNFVQDLIDISVYAGLEEEEEATTPSAESVVITVYQNPSYQNSN